MEYQYDQAKMFVGTYLIKQIKKNLICRILEEEIGRDN
jgi:hypothetical protein